MRKLLVSILIGLTIFTSVAPNFLTIQAATKEASPSATWYDTDFSTWYSKVYDQSASPPNEIFGERYTAAQVEWVIYGLFAFVINHTSGTGGTCLASNDLNNCIEQLGNFFSQAGKSQSNAPNIRNQSWASLLFPKDRSLSAISYVRNKIENFSLVPVAHAQSTGFGFSAFNPIVSLWQAVRDFSFLLAVIAAVILAFMIMFRVKISPQAVITAQSAIPKVIIALIFVAFSYAIAGLLVDLTYVIIGLVSLFFNLIADPKVVFEFMTNGPKIGLLPGLGIFSLMFMYLIMFGGFLFLSIEAISTGAALGTGIGIGNLLGGGQIGGGIGIAVGGTIGGIISGVLTILFTLVAIIALIVLLFIFIKIVWLMIKTLAQIYLLVIFGPLQIIAGAALPSSGGLGVGAWAKALFSNLIVYPVVGALFVLAFVFIKFASDIALKGTVAESAANSLFNQFLGLKDVVQAQAGAGWTPPLTLGGPATLPLIFLSVSFVIITIIPKTTELIQSIVSGKPFGFGTAIGEAVVSPFANMIRLGVTTSKIGQAINFRKGAENAPAPASAPSIPATQEPT